jgi:PAS domain S-box-containing protein
MTTVNNSLNLLVIEDSPADFSLLERHLKRRGLAVNCQCVLTSEELKAAVERTSWDAVLSDYTVPGMDFGETLNFLKTRNPDLPLILVAGSVGEEKAVELLKQGVWDFVLKDNLTRLAPAIERSLREVAGRNARKSAEESLRESELAFRTLAESMPQIVWVCGPDGLNTYFNQQWVRYTGLTLEASSGNGWNIPFHPDDRLRALDAWQRSVKNGDVYELECRLRRVDAVYRWWLIRGTPQRDGNGTILKWFGTCTDIDDLKRAEAASRENRSKLDAALSSMTDAVFISDCDGKFIEFNDAFAKFHRFKDKSECAKHLSDYPAIIEVSFANGDSAPVEQWAVPRALAGESATNAEYIIRRKDTRETWVGCYSFNPIRDKNGVIVGSVVVGRDITEQKQKTEELRSKTAFLEALVYSSMDGILVVDNQRRKIFQNQRAIDLWKIPKDIAENPDAQLQYQFAREQTKNPDEFSEKSERVEFRPDEFIHDEIELKDGTILERQTSLIKAADGKCYGRFWTFRDITKGRQLEAQLRQAQKMEAIGTLAGGIAHDFNNILAAMFGYAYLLEQDVAENPAARESLAEILRAADRAKDLVQQILTFSRQREQKRQVLTLGIIVKEVMKFLRASLPSNIKIEVNLAANVPSVLADPAQVHQVVMNLATNAFHAMEGLNGQLTVSLDLFEPEAEFIRAHPEFHPLAYGRLIFADTGHGMDARTLERIYEPFFTTKPLGKGTGLGLAVVHGIMRSHEGVIMVKSTVGQGTTNPWASREFADHFGDRFQRGIE